MIVSFIGIVMLTMTILLIARILNNIEIRKGKYAVEVIRATPHEIKLLVMFGIVLLVAIGITVYGISIPKKIGEWEVKETIKPVLLNDEENIFNGYTYQYLIPEKGGTKSNVINYEVKYLFQNVPILVKCERKAKPTIWTLGLAYKETKYVFYSPGDIID